MSTKERLLSFLVSQQVIFRYVEHNQVVGDSCQDAATARGLDLKYGAKSLLLTANDSFFLFTLSAAKQVNSNRIRKILQTQKLRFATVEELWRVAKVKKGALPPFARPLFEIDHYIDESIMHLEQLAFNAGELESSCIMPLDEYLRLTIKRLEFPAQVVKFSK